MDQHLSVELNEANLLAFLAEHGLLAAPERAQVQVLSGGVSNLAFWVETPDGPVVVKQARPRLAVEMEWRADVGRVIREAEAMAWLHERLGPPRIPRLIWLHRDAKVLVMEAVTPPAENYKARLLRGEVDPALGEAFGGLLADMHNATRDAATQERFGDTGYFDELRLSPYYDTVAEKHPPVAAHIGALRRECLQSGWCLVHGDYSPKNVLVRPAGLLLLDYEVAHWGNPCFDIGFALTHLLCKALHLPARREALLESARRFWSRYTGAVLLPEASRAQAGYHLAAIMLARMDGKSPLEYFTDEAKRETVRRIAIDALLAGDTTVPGLIATVERQPA